MQTYMGLVRNPADATLIFEACRQGKLPRIQRRLSDRERHAIRSGSIFVWDEKEAGMRRWTDGKSWSASRVAGSFLTYREMEGKRAISDGSSQQRGHGVSGDDSDENHDSTDNKYEMTESYKYKVDGLIKQSFSITTSEDQKLHLISYYGRSHPNNVHLRPPTQDPALMHIHIPRGLYPESTLDVAGSPNQIVQRVDDRHYSVHHPAGASLPPTPGYAAPRVQSPYTTSSQNNSYGEPAWDPRNSSNSRPREIRPAVYDSFRDHPNVQSKPTLHPLHHTPVQSLHSAPIPPAHTNNHAVPPHMSHAPLFHPYAYPSHQTPDKAPAHELQGSHQHFRTPNQGSQSYAQSQQLSSVNTDHSRGIHSTPETTSHASDKFGRRSSGPRSQELKRTISADNPIAMNGTKISPYEAAANAAGQNISLPDLYSTTVVDPSSRPMARDIPTDRLGRWHEETRVLDVLRGAMEL